MTGCATAADIGKFVGWCACSSVVTPRQQVDPPAGSDPWCPAATAPVPTWYCDKGGRGNCALLCTAPIWACKGPVKASTGKCDCEREGLRTVLRYNGPLTVVNIP